MKVFISADIEGITTTSNWKECDKKESVYAQHAKHMTEEVLACIRGIKKAGAREIVVKDAHDSGTNIDPTKMPSGVTLLRGWNGHPYSMAYGVDETFDAAMFIGYHSSAGRKGNPLAHTINSSNIHMIKVNGILTSEFLLFSWAAALEKVPTVFLSGDKTLCEDFKDLHPKLITCPTKDGVGGLTVNYSIEDTLKNIEALSEKSLTQSLDGALTKLPESFTVQITYKILTRVEKVIWFPGVKKVDDTTIEFSSNDYFEILRTFSWILNVS